MQPAQYPPHPGNVFPNTVNPNAATPPEEAAEPTHAIEAAMAGLDGLEDVPVADHVARFDAVHVALTDALSSVDRA